VIDGPSGYQNLESIENFSSPEESAGLSPENKRSQVSE
jgi:hypothetical protein